MDDARYFDPLNCLSLFVFYFGESGNRRDFKFVMQQTGQQSCNYKISQIVKIHKNVMSQTSRDVD